MANIRLIKGRIKSSKNIAQITKAMELVAAAKMKKAQAAALSGKLYAEKIYEMVMRVAKRTDYRSHPLMTAPAPTGKRLLLIISTNKGLCGGLNAQLFRYILRSYPELSRHDIITLGKKGADFVTRTGHPVKADFSDSASWEGAIPAIVELLTTSFMTGAYDSVDVLSNEFLSVVRQEPRVKTVLPLTIEKEAEQDIKESTFDILIEPTAEEVFDSLLPHYIENQLRDAVLEGAASEHSARMIAMHNATDNAKSLQHELTLQYNKVRQEKITYEITDMVTARMAVDHI